MFFLIAIFLIIFTPLAVPAAVSLLHALSGWKKTATPTAVPAAA